MIIVCDVDGTVCDSCQVMKGYVADVISALPNTFVFLSGTDESELRRMVDEPLAAKGKGCVLLPNSGAQGELPQKQTVIAACKKAAEEFGLPDLGDGDQILDRGSQVTLSCIGRSAPSEKKRHWDPLGVKRRRIIGYLEELLPNHSIRLGGTTSIDITRFGFTKAEGMHLFLEANNLYPHEVTYYGDRFDEEGNDYPLLSVVPCVKVYNPDHFVKLMLDRLASCTMKRT